MRPLGDLTRKLPLRVMANHEGFRDVSACPLPAIHQEARFVGRERDRLFAETCLPASMALIVQGT